VAQLIASVQDRVVVQVVNHSNLRLRLELVVPGVGVQPLEWLWPRAATELVVTEDDLRRGCWLDAWRMGGTLFERVEADALATGAVVLGDDREPLAA
jgi:hypothetical protein